MKHSFKIITLITVLLFAAMAVLSSCSNSAIVAHNNTTDSTIVWGATDMESGITVPVKTLAKDNVYLSGDTVWVKAFANVITPVIAVTRENRVVERDRVYYRVILRQQLTKKS